MLSHRTRNPLADFHSPWHEQYGNCILFRKVLNRLLGTFEDSLSKHKSLRNLSIPHRTRNPPADFQSPWHVQDMGGKPIFLNDRFI